MDFDDILEALVPEVFGLLGPESIVLTRPCGLTASKTSATPQALALADAAIAGADSLVLKLPGGGAVRGRLQEGCRLTIAGQIYTVGAEVVLPVPPATSESIGPVSITPALAADAAIGATVALAGPEFTWGNGLVTRVGRTGQEDDLNAVFHLEVSLPVRGAPTVPRKGDGFYRPKDGSRGIIAKIPAELGGSWDLEIGTE